LSKPTHSRTRVIDTLRTEAVPWALWTAVFPLAIGVIAGAIAVSLDEGSKNIWRAAFGNGELYLALAALLGATLGIAMKRKSWHDVPLFFGLIALMATTGAWVVRLHKATPVSDSTMSLLVTTYAFVTIWTVFEFLRQSQLRARLRLQNYTVGFAQTPTGEWVQVVLQPVLPAYQEGGVSGSG
jgi:hypothetical protein